VNSNLTLALKYMDLQNPFGQGCQTYGPQSVYTARVEE